MGRKIILCISGSEGFGEFIEAQWVYYYQRMDTQDLITAGGISGIKNGYLLLSDLGLRALFSVYCAKGKDFDQFIFKNEMKEGYLRHHICSVFDSCSI